MYLYVAKNKLAGHYFKRDFEYDDYKTTDINEALVEADHDRATADAPASIMDTVADYVEEEEVVNWEAVSVRVVEVA